MKTAGWITFAAMSAGLFASAAQAQQKQEKSINPVQLEVSMDVATTTEEGYPSALRITVKNIGNVAVDMPLPVVGCLPQDGHLFVRLEWHPIHSDSMHGHGWGESCGEGCGDCMKLSLTNRIRKEGIHLRPGEFITSSENMQLRLNGIEPGLVEYWIELVPPRPQNRIFLNCGRPDSLFPRRRLKANIGVLLCTDNQVKEPR